MTDQTAQHCRSIAEIPGLPAEVNTTLCELTTLAIESLGEALVSVVLFGSAAEGRLRATSDVNLLFVLTRYTREAIDPLRDTLRLARTTANVQVMYVLHAELTAAADAFAMKFTDIVNRHIVLYGEDPVQELAISREARLVRLRQVLLNSAIRLRERYAMISHRQEHLARVLAEYAGPLRVAAATLLDLQGQPAPSVKAALETLAPTLGVAGWAEALGHLSTARETQLLPPGAAEATFFTVLELCESMRRLAERS